MFRYVKNALLSVVMSREAREKMEAHLAAKARARGDVRDESVPDAPPSARDGLSAPDPGFDETTGSDEAAPSRSQLIRQAMAVHRAKQTVLADLSDEQREKLVALALKQLLRQDRGPGGGPGGGGPRR